MKSLKRYALFMAAAVLVPATLSFAQSVGSKGSHLMQRLDQATARLVFLDRELTTVDAQIAEEWAFVAHLDTEFRGGRMSSREILAALDEVSARLVGVDNGLAQIVGETGFVRDLLVRIREQALDEQMPLIARQAQEAIDFADSIALRGETCKQSLGDLKDAIKVLRDKAMRAAR